jgi:hypothetical protein
MDDGREDGNWADVKVELQRRFPSWRAPMDAEDVWYASPPFDLKRAHAESEAPILRAFVWGFHLELSSRTLRELASAANPVNELLAALGPARGPAAPFVTLAAAFVAGYLHGHGRLDQGDGIYVSMSWFAPGVFIPSAVRGRALYAAQAG